MALRDQKKDGEIEYTRSIVNLMDTNLWALGAISSYWQAYEGYDDPFGGKDSLLIQTNSTGFSFGPNINMFFTYHLEDYNPGDNVYMSGYFKPLTGINSHFDYNLRLEVQNHGEVYFNDNQTTDSNSWNLSVRSNNYQLIAYDNGWFFFQIWEINATEKNYCGAYIYPAGYNPVPGNTETLIYDFKLTTEKIWIQPEYDFSNLGGRVINDHRARSGDEYSYLWGTYNKIKFSQRYLPIDDAQLINRHWDENKNITLTDLTEDRVTGGNVTGRLRGKKKPFGQLEKPYSGYLKGVIELG